MMGLREYARISSRENSMSAYTSQRAPDDLPRTPLDYERKAVSWRARFSVNTLGTGQHAEDAKERWHNAAREAFRMGGED